jgi:hypothetical protein
MHMRIAGTSCNNYNLLYYHISLHNTITFRTLFNHVYLSTAKLGMTLSALQNLISELQFLMEIGSCKHVKSNLFCEFRWCSQHGHSSSPMRICRTWQRNHCLKFCWVPCSNNIVQSNKTKG